MRRYYLAPGYGLSPIPITPPDPATDEGDYIMYHDSIVRIQRVEDDVADDGVDITILHGSCIEAEEVYDADEEELPCGDDRREE